MKKIEYIDTLEVRIKKREDTINIMVKIINELDEIKKHEIDKYTIEFEMVDLFNSEVNLEWIDFIICKNLPNYKYKIIEDVYYKTKIILKKY